MFEGPFRNIPHLLGVLEVATRPEHMEILIDLYRDEAQFQDDAFEEILRGDIEKFRDLVEDDLMTYDAEIEDELRDVSEKGASTG